ncbi:hypothetical protein [Streptomyces sp. AC1-42W]|uniref:hypothetical protein n=1 Tax=Streptomyces sp. AC1-42W TaxID=2218666 RepID=UPI000DAC0CDA|nr:hypothetical protein [Streptomyces sp. AC1-42W]PZT75423.1 hypothetical protein DNK56_18180 [Streptomyces sp. AC1-42W]
MGTRSAAGVALVVGAVLATAGCGGDASAGDGDNGGGGNGKNRSAAAVEAARAYQQAQLDHGWETACGAVTDRLLRKMGADTIAECVDHMDMPRINDVSGVRLTMGRPVELPAYGRHPAGIGLRVSFGPVGRGMYNHTAFRLVPGKRDTWLVDQAVNLADGTGTEAVREALRRK